jgi:hypothetical protein
MTDVLCGRRTFTPHQLVTTALRMANATVADGDEPYTQDDVSEVLLCTLQHTGPLHYGMALNLRGPCAGTLWGLWQDGMPAAAAFELPDCPAISPDAEACCEFDGHPGAHTHQLTAALVESS